MADRIFISELAQAESVNDDLMFVSDDGTQTNKVKASQIKDYVMDNINPDDFGTVKSVNDVLPDESGNITLTAEDIGITPATSGGINPNLLDNWYFGNPVNQRGQTEYLSTTNTPYSIDRWLLGWYSTAMLTDSGIRLFSNNIDNRENGEIIQAIDVKYLETLEGMHATASVLTGEGILYVVKGVVSEGVFVTYVGDINRVTLTQSGGASGRLVVWGYDESIVAVKLELGSEQTLAHQENGVWVLNEIPNYAEELAKCQRYFVAINYNNDFSTLGSGYISSSTTSELIVPIPVTMRAFPVTTIITGFVINTPTSSFVCNEASIYNYGSGCVNLRCTINGGTKGEPCFAYVPSDCQVFFSADL